MVTVEEDDNEEKADDYVMCISDGRAENVFDFNMMDFNNDFKMPGGETVKRKEKIWMLKIILKKNTKTLCDS